MGGIKSLLWVLNSLVADSVRYESECTPVATVTVVEARSALHCGDYGHCNAGNVGAVLLLEFCANVLSNSSDIIHELEWIDEYLVIDALNEVSGKTSVVPVECHKSGINVSLSVRFRLEKVAGYIKGCDYLLEVGRHGG